MQNLKMKIAEDKENANKQNLAEIAAQQSARILEETKARSQLGSGVLPFVNCLFTILSIITLKMWT